MQLLNLFNRRQEEHGGCAPVAMIGGAIMIFLTATVLLWTNEGRVDFGRIGDESIPMETAAMDPTMEGAFVAASGVLVGDGPVGDKSFLRPGDWLAVERLVEMYAWEESSQQSDSDGPTEYDYDTVWTSTPEDSSTFAEPRGHTNPPLTVTGGEFRPDTGRLGAYTVDLPSLELPSPIPLVLNKEQVILREDHALVGEYIFVGKGSLEEPQVGDLRIRFQIVPSGRTATLFGQVTGSRIDPYFHQERDRLYRAFFSGRADALNEMRQEYQFALWGMRAAGLFLYWVSFLLVFSPLTRLLGGIPVLGGLGKGLIAVVTFIPAALLALVVTVTAYLFNNPLVLLVLLLLAGAIIFFGRSFWQRTHKA